MGSTCPSSYLSLHSSSCPVMRFTLIRDSLVKCNSSCVDTKIRLFFFLKSALSYKVAALNYSSKLLLINTSSIHLAFFI